MDLAVGHVRGGGRGGVAFLAGQAVQVLGGLAATLGLYLVATRSGRTSVATMLLAGIAVLGLGIAALVSALTKR